MPPEVLDFPIAVECDECNALGPMVWNQKDAARKWNKRDTRGLDAVKKELDDLLLITAKIGYTGNELDDYRDLSQECSDLHEMMKNNNETRECCVEKTRDQ